MMDKMGEEFARAIYDVEPPTYSDAWPPVVIPFDRLSPKRRQRIDEFAQACAAIAQKRVSELEAENADLRERCEANEAARIETTAKLLAEWVDAGCEEVPQDLARRIIQGDDELPF